MKVGRIRYGVLGSDAGRIMDDGTIARLGEDQYYVTTTSTGADTVIEWFEWWKRRLGIGRRDRQPHGRARSRERRRAALEGTARPTRPRRQW